MVYPVGNRFLHHKAKGKVLLPLMRAYRSMSTYAPDPHVISLNLTRACNLACKMCGQHGTRGNYRSDAACSELPYQDIMRFFHGISSRPLVYLWGGEPLLHPRIMDIIRFLKEEDFPVHLNT
ncbi:MAG: radical SAM protein, partial [Nanoarchaeota archaeon]